MRRVAAALLCLCLLNGAAGAEVLAAALPAAVAPAPGGQDPVAGLRAVLSDALAQASDADGLTLAVQGLENDALDTAVSHQRSAAAVVLLRSISNPRLIADLRAFVLRRSAHSCAREALDLLGRWEAVVNDRASRPALLAGLSGAGDLDSAMAGSPAGETSGLAAASGGQIAAKPELLIGSRPTLARCSVFDSGFDILSPYKAVHSGLAPPGRSPPFLSRREPFPTEKPQKPTSRSKADKTAAIEGVLSLFSHIQTKTRRSLHVTKRTSLEPYRSRRRLRWTLGGQRPRQRPWEGAEPGLADGAGPDAG